MGTFARLNLTGAGMVREAEISTEKMCLSDWPGGMRDVGDVTPAGVPELFKKAG